MPRFEPFAGLRYNPSLRLDLLIAPPYDVVGEQERAELAARHRANAIHVELPVEDRNLSLDRYANAARLFAAWQQDGALRRDAGPCFYTYRMTPPGAAPTTGVIGALACEPVGGDILPHEETIPKDTTDRLDLLRACRANLSPIWGLSLTDGLAATYQPDGEPDERAVDDDGVVHELWVIEDPTVQEAIALGVAASPVVIADGHHRYQTALTYQAEQRARRDGRPGDDLIMALIVELAEDQLRVGPIHRTVTGVPAGTDLVAVLGRWFDTVHAGPFEDAMVETVASSGALTLVTPDGLWLLSPRPETYEAAASDLDSSVVAVALADVPGATTTHHHGWEEAVDAVRSGTAQAALLLRPVTVEQIAAWARDRRRMPPKSTYFFPKPRTGMVYRTLED